jgi:GDP-L-fucose synthase
MKNRNYFESKNILVTGSAGFIGTNLIDKLVQYRANITGTIHEREPQHKHDSVKYIKCDLTKYDDCMNVLKDIDYVFMTAANSSGAEVMETKPLDHLTPNILMNTNMLSAAYENNVKKFCFISSNTVYPLTDHAVKEDDANYEFYDKYYIVGWMKRFTEIMCEMYALKIKKPMPVVIVRPGNIYGPYDKFSWRESKVIAALIRKAIEKKDPFEVWGDGSDIKDFIYVDDFIDALILVFEKSKNFDVINIASGKEVSIKEIIKVVLDKTSYQSASIKYNIDKPTMIPKRLICIDKLTTLTDWCQKTDLDKGIEKTVEWYTVFFKNKSPDIK